MISAIGWGGEASCSRSVGRRFLCVGRAERLEVAGEHVQTPPPSSGHVGATPSIKRYFGRVKLDRINPESKFHDVVTEIISLLSMRVDVDINIRVEIEASAKNDKALDSSLIRAVREDATTLDFEDNDFYEE